MNRVVAVGVLAGLLLAAAGCGEEGKKLPPPPANQPSANELFDKKEADMPKSAKKMKAKPGGE